MCTVAPGTAALLGSLTTPETCDVAVCCARPPDTSKATHVTQMANLRVTDMPDSNTPSGLVAQRSASDMLRLKRKGSLSGRAGINQLDGMDPLSLAPVL